MKTTAVISPINVEKRQSLQINAGDTVRVHQKIQEKGKTRLQMFEGLVLTHKGGKQAGATFTVRRVVDGVGVEKTFPLYSPMIDKIEVVKRSKVRRAKLYYIREKAAKEIRKQMKHTRALGKQTSTGSDIEDKEAVKRAAEEEAKVEAAIQAEKEAAEKAAEEAKAAAEAATAAAAEEMPLEEVKVAEEVGEVAEDK
jgi:large subunit ribosomal protein L19